MKILFATLLVFCWTLPLGAALAEDPVQASSRIIAQIKKDGGLSSEVTQADWQAAFDALDPKERQKLKIYSVDDYKKAYQNIGEKVKESIAATIAKDPSKRASNVGVMKQRVETGLELQQKSMKQAFAETTYMVGKSTVTDGEAEVEIIKKRGPIETKDTAKFVKAAGAWKLKSGVAFNPILTIPTTK